MIKNASYVSASAFLLSAAAHVLILVLLAATGGTTGSGGENGNALPSSAAAGRADGEERSGAGEKSVPVREDAASGKTPVAVVQDADGSGSEAEKIAKNPTGSSAGGGNASGTVARGTADKESADSVRANVSEPETDVVIYTVRRGDTLTKLAEKCGMTISEIAKLNGKSVKKLSNLWVGQKIKIGRWIR